MTAIEEEVILLKAIKEQIDEMVNLEVLHLIGTDPNSSVMFRTSTHCKFFNIVLVDFLSRTDKRASVKQTSYLGALSSICNSPNFDSAQSVTSLKESTKVFIDWLEKEVEVSTWFPSISTEVDVKIKRVTFLKMCGDISKHNFLRAVGVAEDLKETLDLSGVTITIDDALLALTDFYERFHSDILIYHASTIAEFLNNIRWGMYEYLQPEFHRSIVWESRNPPKYRYTYPLEVNTRFAQECYWELMNEVFNPPYIPRFQVNKFFKLRY